MVFQCYMAISLFKSWSSDKMIKNIAKTFVQFYALGGETTTKVTLDINSCKQLYWNLHPFSFKWITTVVSDLCLLTLKSFKLSQTDKAEILNGDFYGQVGSQSFNFCDHYLSCLSTR